MTASSTRAPGVGGFHHEAVFYPGLDALAELVAPFLLEGVERGEAVLVAVPPDRTAVLRDALGSRSDGVTFVDILEIGVNPARIIPVWRAFVEQHLAAPGIRGVGEPVWRERRAAELVECRLHESLLNVAFDGGPEWRLMCPYDASSLSDQVLADARCTHPIAGHGTAGASPDYVGHTDAFAEFSALLPPAPADAAVTSFGARDLTSLRHLVTDVCLRAGLQRDAAEDLVLAAHELATNSVRHGGGTGTLRTWGEDDSLVVEINDSGTIGDPLVGRELGSEFAEGGRGLWMANQLCDLVQVRSSAAGTVVRLHARL